MYRIYDYPSWIIGPLFVAAFVAVIGIFLTRRQFMPGFIENRARMKWSASLSQVTLFYLDSCSSSLRSQHSNVGDIVDEEASSMSALYRDFSAYTRAIRHQLQDALREYARYTIQEGWEQQRKGMLPKGNSRVLV
jgi:hypothetical protein